MADEEENGFLCLGLDSEEEEGAEAEVDRKSVV